MPRHEGWELIQWRRCSGSRWYVDESYDRLTRDEAVDVIDALMGAVAGLVEPRDLMV